MKLYDKNLNKEFEAEILPVESEDFEYIENSQQFQFDWQLERKHFIFKIVGVYVEKEILGLISLINIPQELRMHINLIESSKSHKGKSKRIERIAGCLLAFATQLAFEKGYLGFTSLVPKTKLIPLYVNKYGFSQYGRQLAIERQAAIQLIQKYL